MNWVRVALTCERLQNRDDLTFELIEEINAEGKAVLSMSMKTIELTKSTEKDVLRSLKQEKVFLLRFNQR